MWLVNYFHYCIFTDINKAYKIILSIQKIQFESIMQVITSLW